MHEGLTTLNERMTAIDRRIDALESAISAQAEETRTIGDLTTIDSLSRWLAHASLAQRPLVSIVLPTRNRPRELRRAIASVQAQRYDNWELVVVDDGGSEDSRELVAALGDPRARWLGIPGRGVGAARNAALGEARGEIIAYLDDDNMMDRGWLYAVAWAFEQRPDIDVLYGAFVIDDVLRVAGQGSGALPETFLRRYRKEALLTGNLADMGAMAHRAGLPGAWFDESLLQMGDWDLLVRLTADKDPLVLPAVACYYTTDTPERLSNGPTAAADAAVVIARAEQVNRT